MKKEVIQVEGMGCEHCKNAVTNALLELGCIDVCVNLETGEVSFSHGEEVSMEEIRERIEEEGYDVVK